MAAALPLESLLARLEAAAGDVAPAAPSSAAELEALLAQVETTPVRSGGSAPPASSPSSFALPPPTFATSDGAGEEDCAAVFATPAGRGDDDDSPLTPAEAAAEAAAEAYLAQSTPLLTATVPGTLVPLALSPAEQADTTALRWTPPPAPPALLATPTSAFPLPQLPPSRCLPVFRPTPLSPPRVAQLPPPRDSHLKAAQRALAHIDALDARLAALEAEGREAAAALRAVSPAVVASPAAPASPAARRGVAAAALATHIDTAARGGFTPLRCTAL